MATVQELADMLERLATPLNENITHNTEIDFRFRVKCDDGSWTEVNHVRAWRLRNNVFYVRVGIGNVFHSKYEISSWLECAQAIRDIISVPACKDCTKRLKNHVCAASHAAVVAGCVPERCTICQEDCLGVTRMECGHTFHKLCLTNLVVRAPRTTKCPNCNHPLKSEERYAVVGPLDIIDDYEMDEDEDT